MCAAFAAGRCRGLSRVRQGRTRSSGRDLSARRALAYRRASACGRLRPLSFRPVRAGRQPRGAVRADRLQPRDRAHPRGGERADAGPHPPAMVARGPGGRLRRRARPAPRGGRASGGRDPRLQPRPRAPRPTAGCAGVRSGGGRPARPCGAGALRRRHRRVADGAYAAGLRRRRRPGAGGRAAGRHRLGLDRHASRGTAQRGAGPGHAPAPTSSPRPGSPPRICWRGGRSTDSPASPRRSGAAPANCWKRHGGRGVRCHGGAAGCC